MGHHTRYHLAMLTRLVNYLNMMKKRGLLETIVSFHIYDTGHIVVAARATNKYGKMVVVTIDKLDSIESRSALPKGMHLIVAGTTNGTEDLNPRIIGSVKDLTLYSMKAVENQENILSINQKLINALN